MDYSENKRNVGQRSLQFASFYSCITGCSTTSRVFGIEKFSALKRFTCSNTLRQEAVRFTSANTKSSVIQTGEMMLALLFGWKNATVLTS